MVNKVILLNTLCTNASRLLTSIDSIDDILGMQVIRQSLEESGFDEVIMLPDRSISLRDLDLLSYLANKLQSAVDETDTVTVGLNANTQEYFKFELMTKFVRTFLPQARIIAGGRHFKREELTVDNKPIRDSVQIALEDQLVDGVVVGEAQPFIDLVTKKKGEIQDGQIPGLYSLNDGVVQGRGRGRYPSLDVFPFLVDRFPLDERWSQILSSENYLRIQGVINNSCPNACDFCSSYGGSPNTSNYDKALMTLREVMLAKPIVLKLFDANPIRQRLLPFYSSLFEELDELNPQVYKSLYLSPTALTEEGGIQRVLDFVVTYKVYDLFIGRDAVTHEDAKFIGSNLNGTPKTQKQLDEEKEALTEFMSLLSEKVDLSKNPLGHTVSLSYIVHPFMKRNDALRLYSEMVEFNEQETHNLSFALSINPLVLFPGTKARSRHLDLINGPEEFKALQEKYWKPAAHPGDLSDLIELYTLRSYKKRLTHQEDFQLIHDVFYGASYPE